MTSGATVLALAGAGLAFTASPAQAAIAPSASPSSIAAAIAGPGANVTGASWVNNASPAAGSVSDTVLTSFPTDGSTFGILSSGRADSADDPNGNPPPESTGTSDDKTANFGGGNVRGTTDFDVSVLKVDLSVPSTANCLSFDFQFLTEEFNDFVGVAFNDAFIAELDVTTWDTPAGPGNPITAPDNFAFDTDGDVVSVNAVGLGGFSRANAGNTTYDGATPALSAATQVTPGAHSLYLSIFDQGDRILDSTAFVDNLRVGFVPDPAVQCVPGAQVKSFDLDLAPPTATLSTGQSHTVTATLTEVEAGNPAVVGASILFQATGANTATGADTTDSAGQATFSYSGSNVGTDAVSACYDINGNGVCNTEDPVASVTVDWVNAPPVIDAGGPYTGVEGGDVAISGSASDPDGDALTHAWTATAGAGVDPGATCGFDDPSALSTTVSCTDDGSWTLTLETADGTNPAVTDTADLTVANLAPEITAIGTPVDPVAVGTPVTVTADYTDPGSNDTHTASVDWVDGAVTTPAASAGSLSSTHSYTAAGIYTVCVTVTDDDLDSDEECAESYVVVYDPGAGFVTGGGWIQVAPGSYDADPTLSGPGRFGFVSKYHKGATVPTGNTEFQFHAAGLNFHSSSYEWLVVAGHKAIYKGEGTVNGQPGYRFLVSAVDGARPGGGGADKFRIKIWDGTGVVFDNQAGAPDGATASTELARGSIVIHG